MLGVVLSRSLAISTFTMPRSAVTLLYVSFRPFTVIGLLSNAAHRAPMDRCATRKAMAFVGR